MRRLNRGICKEGSTFFCRNTEKVMLCLRCEIFPRVVCLNIWSPARHAGMEGCVTFRNWRKESRTEHRGLIPFPCPPVLSLFPYHGKPAVSQPCRHVFSTLMKSMPSWPKLTLFPLCCFSSGICSLKKMGR